MDKDRYFLVQISHYKASSQFSHQTPTSARVHSGEENVDRHINVIMTLRGGASAGMINQIFNYSIGLTLFIGIVTVVSCD